MINFGDTISLNKLMQKRFTIIYIFAYLIMKKFATQTFQTIKNLPEVWILVLIFMFCPIIPLAIWISDGQPLLVALYIILYLSVVSFLVLTEEYMDKNYK